MAIEIDLYGVDVGIVIPWPSGIIYGNQADGVCCNHYALEGILVPIVITSGGDAVRYDAPLVSYFNRRPGNRGELTPEDADAIDAIMAGAQTPFVARVDRSKLADSFEAWVHVTLDLEAGRDAYRPTLDLAYPCPGILVWENSD